MINMSPIKLFNGGLHYAEFLLLFADGICIRKGHGK